MDGVQGQRRSFFYHLSLSISPPSLSISGLFSVTYHIIRLSALQLYSFISSLPFHFCVRPIPSAAALNIYPFSFDRFSFFLPLSILSPFYFRLLLLCTLSVGLFVYTIPHVLSLSSFPLREAKTSRRVCVVFFPQTKPESDRFILNSVIHSFTFQFIV